MHFSVFHHNLCKFVNIQHNFIDYDFTGRVQMLFFETGHLSSSKSPTQDHARAPGQSPCNAQFLPLVSQEGINWPLTKL